MVRPYRTSGIHIYAKRDNPVSAIWHKLLVCYRSCQSTKYTNKIHHGISMPRETIHFSCKWYCSRIVDVSVNKLLKAHGESAATYYSSDNRVRVSVYF